MSKRKSSKSQYQEIMCLHPNDRKKHELTLKLYCDASS